MPKFLTPDGRADLELTTDDLVEHLKANCRGLGTQISGSTIAQMYDIKWWQATTCAMQARVQLRLDDEVLCGRTGPGGGYFVAADEGEARAYGLQRTSGTLTAAENIVKDIETAIRGLVRSTPSTAVYWKRSRTRLNGIANELSKVRGELGIAAAAAAGELDPPPEDQES